jgi:hypothetical protein
MADMTYSRVFKRFKLIGVRLQLIIDEMRRELIGV